MSIQRGAQHSIQSTNLADLLERVLDKGIVIAGDIKIKLVDVELLTLQIRLVICSVDKAKEIGIDWWGSNSAFASQSPREQFTDEYADIRERLTRLEGTLAKEAVLSDPAC
jgi:hypothetical protein